MKIINFSNAYHVKGKRATLMCLIAGWEAEGENMVFYIYQYLSCCLVIIQLCECNIQTITKFLGTKHNILDMIDPICPFEITLFENVDFNMIQRCIHKRFANLTTHMTRSQVNSKMFYTYI